MKFLSYLMIGACMALSFTACDKDEEPVEETPTEEPTPDPDPVAQDEYFKWEIDREEFLSKDDERFHTFGVTEIGTFKTLQMTGREADGKTGLRFNINQLDDGFTGTLNYTTTDEGLSFVYNHPDPVIDYVCGRGQWEDGLTDGTLVITRYDDYIEGTFEFNGIDLSNTGDSKSITNGSFRVKTN